MLYEHHHLELKLTNILLIYKHLDMNLLNKVSSVMSTDLITISEDEPLTKVEEIFRKNMIHHIPVVHTSRLVGIVSKSDYLFFKRGFNDQTTDKKIDLFRLKTHTVGDIMTKGIATMQYDEKINIALEIFKENLFHAIPIMEDDRLVGILSTYDIVKQLADDKGAINEYN